MPEANLQVGCPPSLCELWRGTISPCGEMVEAAGVETTRVFVLFRDGADLLGFLRVGLFDTRTDTHVYEVILSRPVPSTPPPGGGCVS